MYKRINLHVMSEHMPWIGEPAYNWLVTFSILI